MCSAKESGDHWTNETCDKKGLVIPPKKWLQERVKWSIGI